MIAWIRVLGVRLDNEDIYDFYQVGQSPEILSQENYLKDKTVTKIEIHHTAYTTAAMVWFEDWFEYVENVKSYYGKRNAQGETSDVQRGEHIERSPDQQ